jgi:hypothetical protein
MTRSRVACRSCGADLGAIAKPSGVFRRARGVEITYINLKIGTATLRCTCGVTTDYTGHAIDLG